MSNDQIHPRVQELIDRQDILDCLMRYSRGVDRFDVDMIRSVYHPDATDDHGAFVGNPEQFVEWVLDLHGTGQISTQHQLTNHSCEIDGNTAHTETYFFFVARNRDESVWIAGGRYLDRFEKRNGRWAIAARKCIIEWGGALGDIAIPAEALAAYAATGVASRDGSDPSYQRPLNVTRAHQVLPF